MSNKSLCVCDGKLGGSDRVQKRRRGRGSTENRQLCFHFGRNETVSQASVENFSLPTSCGISWARTGHDSKLQEENKNVISSIFEEVDGLHPAGTCCPH